MKLTFQSNSSVYLIIPLCVTCFHFAKAQEYPRKEINLTEIADELYGFQDLDLNYEELYENLVQLLAEPFDLNKVNAEELRFLKVLSESQLKNLISYRNENGNFISVYELQAVPEFDLTTLYKLIPFIKVSDQGSTLNTRFLKRIPNEGDHYIVLRYERTLQEKKGFSSEVSDDQKFLGSPDKFYTRFRSSKPGDFSFGFTFEKDAGEQVNWNTSKKMYGMDYLSFHAQVQNKGRIKNLIIGDYQNQFGQGLMLGGMFGMGKGGETITTTRRSNIGVLPYASVYEAGYLRGAATTVKLSKHIFVTGFYSNANRDARLINEDNDETISSFQQTGLHRNKNELATRKTINEQNYGAILQLNHRQFDAGIMFNQVTFSSSVLRQPTAYNQFAFNGIQNQNLGVYLNYTFQNITFFSEFVSSIERGYARLGGILWSLTPKLDISIVNRKYDRNYFSFHANGFAESSVTQNESGSYWGWKYRFNKRFSAVGYIDFFKFPWLKYRSYAPSNGHEWLLRFTYQPSKTTAIFIQAREESKQRNLSKDINLYKTGLGKKYNYCINFDYGIGRKVKLKSRAQFSTFEINNHTTHGLTLLQDVSIDLGKFGITARYSQFDTDDYDNRQYVYERDVWLAYSLPAYDGTGIRSLLMMEFKATRQLTFWLRYTHTRFTDRDQIGTGVDAIDGNIRNDIKFQMRLKF
ncbi:MAG TPA: helix-hairpin-helix domain-containing protein [Chryseolinea sp.]|nr:helix-hairpin-helix domain-containing protein [Chryseolinea sp.]